MVTILFKLNNFGFYLLVPIASNSSIKIIAGFLSFARANASLTSLAPSPINICTNCGPANFKNVDWKVSMSCLNFLDNKEGSSVYKPIISLVFYICTIEGRFSLLLRHYLQLKYKIRNYSFNFFIYTLYKRFRHTKLYVLFKW